MKIIYWIWCFPQMIAGLFLRLFVKVELKEKYKNAVVYKCNLKSGSISLGNKIFLCKEHWNDEYVKKHEYGHCIQLDNMGFCNYIRNVAIPSVGINLLSRAGKLPYDYYGAPWEAEADTLGGVNRTSDNTPWPVGSYSSLWDIFKMLIN